jgi:hypothetical protein
MSKTTGSNQIMYSIIFVCFIDLLDEVEFFHPSSRTMALGSTQPLTEMSTRNLPGG